MFPIIVDFASKFENPTLASDLHRKHGESTDD